MPHRSKCHRQGALVPRLADGLIVVIVDYRWVSLMTGATLDAKSAENRLVADSASAFSGRVWNSSGKEAVFVLSYGTQAQWVSFGGNP